MSPRDLTNSLYSAMGFFLIKLMINRGGWCVNITANSIHPGVAVTNIFRQNSVMQGVMNKLVKFIGKNVEQGAATTCYVALHPQVSGISGEYFADSNLAKASSLGRDIVLAKKLWDFSMNLTQKNTESHKSN
ncbi:Short-chain dehydrogenase TIC 32, chloroplastic [Stylosanthes scabra]|uniref:Short-chain dehydrogenase TIC 32, chloroplastic n=1 Tax=Stylosanthes scabra TaxID=79078 RepID=A0ABU6YTJ6_9FABA|nr:Short-chain dehydrogenase TIC 32, chloroplastic [Stylosanthes scabra]